MHDGIVGGSNGPRRAARGTFSRRAVEPRDEPLRVLLVEDHGAVRLGLELYLTAHGFRVIAAVADGPAALRAAAQGTPDIAIVDLLLPGPGGTEVIAGLLAQDPDLRAIAYTGAGEDLMTPALEAGARAFVLKSGPPERLAEAIEVVAAGGTYLDPALPGLAGGRPHAPTEAGLTPREREVLLLLAHGLNGSEVAERLLIAPATVRTHVQNAMRKLGARTRSQAVALALRGDA